MRLILIILLPIPEEFTLSSPEIALPSMAPAQPPDVQQLYSDHYRWLHNWLSRKLRCTHAAADLAHDTFVRIMASRDALLGVREPRAYLTTTAKRLLIDRSRRNALEQAYLVELELLRDILPDYPSPDEILSAIEALEQIAVALDGLPAKVREAFLRHYLEEQTQAAIAADMGVSKRMVQKYLVQALLHCRTRCPEFGQNR